MKLKTKQSPFCTGCYYAKGKEVDGWFNECAKKHNCCPADGQKVIFVPDIVADKAEAWASKIEAWGKVPSARAILIEGLCNFGNDLLAWNHPVLLPAQFVPVLAKIQAVDLEAETYTILHIGLEYKWCGADDKPLADQRDVLGWRYIID